MCVGQQNHEDSIWEVHCIIHINNVQKGENNHWQILYQLIGPIQREFEKQITTFCLAESFFHQDNTRFTDVRSRYGKI